MWDREHGGFFARVDRRGRPLWEGMKHPHGVTYAALAFRLVAPVMPDAELWASRALNWLDSVAWDESEGGYWGSYRRDNQRYAPGSRLPTHDGKDVLGHLPDLKDVNTLADAIAMLAAFASSGAIGKCAERLDTLVGLLTERLIDPAGIMPYAYRRDWRPVAGVAWTGHQFQMARTIALAACSPRLTFQALARSRELVDFLSLACSSSPRGLSLRLQRGRLFVARRWPNEPARLVGAARSGACAPCAWPSRGRRPGRTRWISARARRAVGIRARPVARQAVRRPPGILARGAFVFLARRPSPMPCPADAAICRSKIARLERSFSRGRGAHCSSYRPAVGRCLSRRHPSWSDARRGTKWELQCSRWIRNRPSSSTPTTSR